MTAARPDTASIDDHDNRSSMTGCARNAVGLQVELITDRAGFDALEEQWNALVERSDDQLFYRHDFLRLWLEQFAADDELRLLVVRDSNRRLTAALPLLAAHSRVYGVPAREWRAAANHHSCRFDLLADNPQQAAAALVAWLASRDDWDVLKLIDVPLDGAASWIEKVAVRAGLAAGSWGAQQSPYASLPADWETFQAGLRRRFRASLRRRRKRLQALGRLTVERVDRHADLTALLDEAFRLEAGGWKGRAGTAIVQDPATLGFYRELAAQAAADGRLALWFLRLDGRAIAFDLALEHGRRLLLLKTGYDETFASYSPGQLLLEAELRDAVARHLDECEFLGNSSPAKLDWTRQTRPHAWLYLFRGARGRLAHLLKFRIGQVVKRRLHGVGLPAVPGQAERATSMPWPGSNSHP